LLQHLHRRPFRLTCLWLWCAAWVVVSAVLLLPVRVPPEVTSDLVAHFALFAAMAFATISFCHDPLRLTGLALLTVVGGTILEVAQGYVPYRTFDLLDALANALGVAVGYLGALVVLYLVIRPTRPRLRSAEPSRL
jgi:VanZ family protein